MVRLHRLRLGLLAIAACALGVAAPAGAKEGVRASLANPAQLRAAHPGDRISVAWTLNAAPRLPVEGGRLPPRPFGASGVYLLVTAGRAGAPLIVSARPPAGARGYPAGRYVADVTVPAGGIASIAIGLEGYKYVQDNPPVRADVFFPIDNNPFASADVDTGGGEAPPWGALAAALVLIALLLVAYRALGARRPAT